ncbi:hypothetical protein HYX13_05380 [Candidatus Woesearchaeota archaeon]|nr:hypothetical protein [Candidatus Woesearchaeota archaeon]
MKETSIDVEVRAYDLGGYGDIAGAIRLASHLQRTGFNTVLYAASDSALSKARTLQPDVPIKQTPSEARILLDVAGHYKDNRNRNEAEVPHLYVEDMDNPQSRSTAVPLYLKTGLKSVGKQIEAKYGGFSQNPLFYRPFREWDLPQPNQRDVRKLLLDAFSPSPSHSSSDSKAETTAMSQIDARSELEKALQRVERFAFGHFRPHLERDDFFNSPYLHLVTKMAEEYDTRFALGFFFGGNLENEIAEKAEKMGYGVVRKNKNIFQAGNSKMPVLIFLGPQPQLRTTSLFLSANMPNIVTGDLSLSDALYGVLAQEGPAFFYDCPSWKRPTFDELSVIMSKLSISQCAFFNAMSSKEDGGFNSISRDQDFESNLEPNLGFLDKELHYSEYRDAMQQALRKEIVNRFGRRWKWNGTLSGRSESDFFIPSGVPFFLQDATEAVVRKLYDNPKAYAEIEESRKRIAPKRSKFPLAQEEAGQIISSLPKEPKEPLKLIMPEDILQKNIEKLAKADKTFNVYSLEQDAYAPKTSLSPKKFDLNSAEGFYKYFKENPPKKDNIFEKCKDYYFNNPTTIPKI